MAITVGTGTSAYSEGTTVTVNKPSGVSDGDLLVAVICSDTGYFADVAAPAGWTLVTAASIDQGAFTAGNLKTFTRIVSGDGASYTFDHYDGAATAITIVPIFGAGATPTLAWAIDETSTTETAPSVTASAASDGLVCWVFIPHGASSTPNYSPPSGMTEVADTASTGWASMAAAKLTPVGSAGATGTKDFSVASITKGTPEVTISMAVADAGGGSSDGSVSGVAATSTGQAAAPAIAASSTVAGVAATSTATAIAPSATASSTVTAAAATTTAAALPPAVSGSGTSANVSAVTATVTASAPAPAASGESVVTGGGPAAATAQAGTPSVSAGALVAAVAATVTIAALAPSVTTTGAGQVSAVRAVATATASAPAVSAGATVTAVRATSSAAANVPSAGGTTAGAAVATVATATAAATAPVVAGVQNVNVASIVAGAVAAATAPVVTSYDTPTVTPTSRTLIVPAEIRVLVVPAENRTLEA